MKTKNSRNRIKRWEYFVTLVVVTLLGAIFGAIPTVGADLALLGLSLFHVPLLWMRMVDSGRPGWLAFLCLIPLLGLVVVLMGLILPSEEEELLVVKAGRHLSQVMSRKPQANEGEEAFQKRQMWVKGIVAGLGLLICLLIWQEVKHRPPSQDDFLYLRAWNRVERICSTLDARFGVELRPGNLSRSEVMILAAKWDAADFKSQQKLLISLAEKYQ